MKKASSGDFEVKARVWVDAGEDSFLGEGRIRLLHKIKEKGSLTRAAAEMQMSYKKAWLSVRKMNEFSPQTLVVLSRGGSDGGQATLTEYAELVIAKYEDLNAALIEFLKTQNEMWEEFIKEEK
jgi:molybdate transport system regulatory protein